MSAKYSRKPLSKLLTSILSAVKTEFPSYCDSSSSRGGLNQMWILKNSKDLLEYIQSRSVCSCKNIKTMDISTLYYDSTKKLSETDIIKMLEFLIDNIFVMFGGPIFQQTVFISMGTNYASLLTDLFLLIFVRGRIHTGTCQENEKKIPRSFNFTFRYKDDVLSLNNSTFLSHWAWNKEYYRYS